MPVNGSLSVKQTSQRRSIVFDPQKRDIVVDLDDLIANRIGLDAFFGEIYLTEGIKTLMEYAFKRLEGGCEQGAFRLKQAVGSGKIHNLITLGLLAKHPRLRQKVMESSTAPTRNDSDTGRLLLMDFIANSRCQKSLARMQSMRDKTNGAGTTRRHSFLT